MTLLPSLKRQTAALRALGAALALAALAPVAVAQSAPSPLASFTRTINAAISGYNREHLTAVTPEACAAACVNDARKSWCVSFDYDKTQSACDLSNARAGEVGGLKTDYAGNPYDHYALNVDALKDFARTADAAISGHNTEHLNAVSPQDCAAACTASSRAAWCRSFDFFKTQQQCDLSDKRASDVGGLKTDYPGNPYDHYALVQGLGVPNPVTGPNGRKHVLVIGIDGLRGDALFCAGCVPTPALSALAASGAYHRNVLAGGSQETVSGPGWATLFTGYWADQHGVTSNDASLPLRKPHVFDRLKQRYPTATVAVVGDWFNITHNLKADGSDFVVMNAAKNSQQATDTVKGWLSWTNPPTAIFYYLHNVDIHAASYDPFNAFYQSKIAAEDAQIQQVLDALAARPTYAQEEWLIVVVSDHGGSGSGHGGQSAGERDAALILTNSYRNPTKPAYCQGDLTGTTLPQTGALTPHVLDFLGLPNDTAGAKHPACGQH